MRKQLAREITQRGPSARAVAWTLIQKEKKMFKK
jgi:hypothetical protein